MTTFRSRALGLDDVIYVGAGLSQPDAVGIEVETLDRKWVFDVMRMRDGRGTICVLAPPGEAAPGFEIEIDDFRAMLDRCLADIEDWEAKLRVPGGPWA